MKARIVITAAVMPATAGLAPGQGAATKEVKRLQDQCAALRAEQAHEEDSFEAFLADRLARTPEKHKPFVRKVADLFEVEIPTRGGSN